VNFIGEIERKEDEMEKDDVPQQFWASKKGLACACLISATSWLIFYTMMLHLNGFI